MLRRAKARIEGHLNYYAITDNLRKCSAYRHFATNILFKWLNRKSPAKDLHVERIRAGTQMGRVAKDLYPQKI